MAKNYSKQESKASLIFIWILILLLVVGWFFVIKSYNEQTSKFISSDGIETAFSETLGKPAGKITKDELASVEGAQLYAMGDSSLAVYYLKGYNDLAEDEDASKYIVQATLPQDEFIEELGLFTGIKTLDIMNYSGEDLIFDMAKIPADTYKNLKEFYTSGVTVDNSDLVNTHTGLTTLGLAGAGLTSIPDISALSNLEVVDLSDNELTSVAGLEGLDNEKITNIYLAGNTIEDYSPIAHIDEAKITKAYEEAESEVEEVPSTEETETADESAEADTADGTEATEEAADEADNAEETAEEADATEEAAEPEAEPEAEEAAE